MLQQKSEIWKIYSLIGLNGQFSGGLIYMADRLQGVQFMWLMTQNAHYVLCPSDKTVLSNLLLNISIEILEVLCHAECLKIVLRLFEVILQE